MISIGGIGAQLTLDTSGWTAGLLTMRSSLAAATQTIATSGAQMTTGLQGAAGALNTAAAGLRQGATAATAHGAAMTRSGNAAQGASRQYRQAAQEANGLAHFLQTGVSMATHFAVAFAIFQGGRAVIGGLANAVVDFNSRLEQARIGWGNMLGDMRLGEVMIRDLQKFAATTSFEFPALQQNAQTMMALGFAAKDIIPTLTQIGNVMTASGDVSEDRLNRIIRAMGQMQSKGRVMAEEMNQLAEAQIPAWDILSEKLGVTRGQAMAAVEAGTVTAEVFREAFNEWSNANFGDAMAKQAALLNVSMSNIRDNLRFFAAEAFRPIFDGISLLAKRIADFTAQDEFRAWAVSIRVWTTIAMEAMGLLGDIFATVLGGILNTVSTTGQAIYRALQWLNPFAAHSQPLTESVDEGVSFILERYSHLASISDIFTRVGGALEHFRTTSAGALNSFDTEKLAREGEVLASVFGRDVVRAYQAALSEMREMVQVLPALSRAIKEQEAVVRTAKQEVDDSTRTMRDQEHELREIELGGRVYRDALRDLRNQLVPLKDNLDNAKDALREKRVEIQNARDALIPYKDKVDETAAAESKLRDQTSRLKDELRDLVQTPIEGEAAFRRQTGAIEDQIDSLDAKIAASRARRGQELLGPQAQMRQIEQQILRLQSAAHAAPGAPKNPQLDQLMAQRDRLRAQMTQTNPEIAQLEDQRAQLKAQLEALNAARAAQVNPIKREIAIAQAEPEAPGQSILDRVKDIAPRVTASEQAQRAAHDAAVRAKDDLAKESDAVEKLELSQRNLESAVRMATDMVEAQERRIALTENAQRDWMAQGDDIRADLEEQRVLHGKLSESYDVEREKLGEMREGYQEVTQAVRQWESALKDTMSQAEQVHQWRRQEEEAEKQRIAALKAQERAERERLKQEALNKPGLTRAERQELPGAEGKIAQMEADAEEFAARVDRMREDAMPLLNTMRTINDLLSSDLAQSLIRAAALIGVVTGAVNLGGFVWAKLGTVITGVLTRMNPLVLAAMAGFVAYQKVWESNFLGIREFVEDLMERLGPLGMSLETVAALVGIMFGPERMAAFEAWTTGIGKIFADMEKIEGPLEKVAFLIGSVFGEEAQGVFERISTAVSTFVSDVRSAFDGLDLTTLQGWAGLLGRLFGPEVMAAFEAFSGLIGKTAERFDIAMKMIRIAWDRIMGGDLMGGLGLIQNAFRFAFADIGGAMNDWAENTLKPWVQNTFVPWIQNDFVPALGLWKDAFFGWVGETANELGTRLHDDWIPRFVAFVEANWPPFVAALGDWKDAFFGWIADRSEELWNKLKDEWIPAFLGFIHDMATDFINALGPFLVGVMKWIELNGPVLLRRLQGEWIPAFVGWILEKDAGGASMMATFMTNLGVVLFRLGEWIITSSFEVMKGFVTVWVPAFAGWIMTSAWPAIIEKLRELLTAWWGWVTGEGGAAFIDMGAALAAGLVTGITMGLRGLKDLLGGIVNGAIEGVKGLVITQQEGGSPFRVWARDVGYPLGEGIALGIEQSKGAILEALNGAVATQEMAPVTATLVPPVPYASRTAGAPAGGDTYNIKPNITIDTVVGNEREWASNLGHETAQIVRDTKRRRF